MSEYEVIDGVEVRTIDIIHEYLHAGKMFTAGKFFPDVASDGTAELLIVAGADYPHLVYAIRAGGDAEMQLYEAVTTSDDGTAMTVHNMDRNSENTAKTKVYYSPTVTDTGTALPDELLPGGQLNQSSGGAIRQATEWIFKPNTKYLVRATNLTTGDRNMSIEIQFYEATK